VGPRPPPRAAGTRPGGHMLITSPCSPSWRSALPHGHPAQGAAGGPGAASLPTGGPARLATPAAPFGRPPRRLSVLWASIQAHGGPDRGRGVPGGRRRRVGAPPPRRTASGCRWRTSTGQGRLLVSRRVRFESFRVLPFTSSARGPGGRGGGLAARGPDAGPHVVVGRPVEPDLGHLPQLQTGSLWVVAVVARQAGDGDLKRRAPAPVPDLDERRLDDRDSLPDLLDRG